MKTKKIIIPGLLLVLSTFTLFAQQKVTLQSKGVTKVFGGANPFSDAYTAAKTGDTLYLPGGNLPYPGTIDKSLVIYGAGHYPDSTSATAPTILNGGITFNENADNMKIEGIRFNGNIYISNNHKIDNLVITRCRCNGIVYYGDQTTPCINNRISECVIVGGTDFANLKSSVITNCIIQAQISNGVELGISNNIFLYNDGWYGYYTLNNVDNSMISNNIFTRGDSPNSVHVNCELNTFSNNVFKDNPGVGSNTFNNNFTGVNISNLFVDQTGYTFDYAHNYHLNSPATYLGTDGRQVGIYGGLFPFKTASVPSNPHIQSKAIAPQTNNNGELQVQIKVKAQTE